jgi:hypothetical protein
MMGTNDDDDYVDDDYGDDKNHDNDRKRWWSLFKSHDRDPKYHLVVS